MIYLVAWIVLGNYSLLNLFLAVLLDGFERDDICEESEEGEEGDNGKNKPEKIKEIFTLSK